ncbi:MAG: Smr/MutS family protein [Acidobacteria bacterium]|nr:Smr/MutS family protein [Acidobacteriota bacterium]
MTPGALRALEFDRIVDVLSGLAVTPTGRDRLASLRPSKDQAEVAAALRATTEGVRFLADHPGFPLRAPADLEIILDALGVEGRGLEPLHLLALAEYLDSIEQARATVATLDASFPVLHATVDAVASFRSEAAGVRRAIAPSGEVVDDASPALASIRDRLRKQRTRLRATLDSFLRGRDTAKYLQEQVVTDRNGRYVLVVRAEHRSAIPGVVHGASASGASLFLEPLATVEINNDIVALEEQETEEVRRILLALTDAFRDRAADLDRTLEVATTLDTIQARARLSQLVDGIEPTLAHDGALELIGARHPLLIPKVIARLEDGGTRVTEPVPVDIRVQPPVRVLVVAGPNTGGKTVALKTAGLLAAMAQAGLHIPVEKGSRLPVFRSLFADIGDEQSIAANLSTFSAHIANVVSMDRELELPALVLLDEVGAGTDPVEGGALGIATIDRFRNRGAHLIATTHYDSLKSYASTTEGVAGAAFGFDPETFAPTYRLVYGSPGRSLAIEIAARLGLPPDVIAAAREQLSEPEKQLAEHLARVDEDLRRLEQERRQIARERERVAESEKQVRAREASVLAREEKVRRRLDAKLDDQLREARRQIDAVIEGLKTRAAEMSERAAVRLRAGSPPGTPARWGAKTGGTLRAAGLSTGEVGEARAEARAALEAIAAGTTDRGADHWHPAAPGAAGTPLEGPPGEPEGLAPEAVAPGSRVMVGALGLEGVVIEVHGKHAEVDVRGKRLRAALRELRPIAAPPPAASVRVNVDLQPREGSLSELNLIGSTVDEALDRLAKFLDQAMVSDVRELRIVHGHGTGQLRRGIAAFLKEHPLVERFETAPENQGGGGATIVYLKD